MTEPKSQWLNFVAYTVVRLLLWLGVWAILQFLTPVKGILALVLALLISSAISIVLLDRQRDAMSESVGAFFGGINRKIESSAAAEDVWQQEILREQSGPSEQSPSTEPVNQDEHSGLLEGDNEAGSDSAAGDEAHGLNTENKTEKD